MALAAAGFHVRTVLWVTRAAVRPDVEPAISRAHRVAPGRASEPRVRYGDSEGYYPARRGGGVGQVDPDPRRNCAPACQRSLPPSPQSEAHAIRIRRNAGCAIWPGRGRHALEDDAAV